MSEISLTYRDGMVVAQTRGDDDEDDGGPGRILTVEEFVERLRDRNDIFGIDRNHRLRNTELVTLLIAIVIGLVTTNASKQGVKITSDFYDKHNAPDMTRTVNVLPELIDRKIQRPVRQEKSVITNSDTRRVLRPSRKSTVSISRLNGNTGIGTHRSRITGMGVLGAISRCIKGRDVAGGDIFGKGGFIKGIDAVISGKSGLQHGGNTVTRRGPEFIGFGSGVGQSGCGGTSIGGIDDIDRLMASQETVSFTPFKTGPPKLYDLRDVNSLDHGSSISGSGRSKSSVLRVVMQNLAALRHAYNKRLREKPGLTGKITVKFAIDEFGSVVHCEVVESTINDASLESAVAGKVSRWRFDRIDKPGDITEVVYPFVFST